MLRAFWARGHTKGPWISAFDCPIIQGTIKNLMFGGSGLVFEKTGGVVRGEDKIPVASPFDQAAFLSLNFLRNCAEALSCASTSFKVGGCIRRKVSMRRASQLGAGTTRCVRGLPLGEVLILMRRNIIGVGFAFVNIGHRSA